MRDGTCPKCQEREVYTGTTQGNEGTLDISVLRAVRLTFYMCGHCGYTEQYVEEQEQRAVVARKWKRIP